ncbi:MAG TPA: DUF6056 family protein, partial [Chloroflexota bacterium]|nr:DUF6056 family protein [Chloroflexota bacterium]
VLLGAVLIAFACGCSETAMTALVTALGLGVVVTAWRARGVERRPLLVTLSVAFVTALASCAVVVAAPGNTARLTYFTRPPLALAMVEMTWFPFFWAFNLALRAPAFVVLGYAIARWIGHLAPFADGAKQHAAARRLVLITGYLTIAASGAPAFYVGGAIPPPRAQIIPQFVLLAMLMGCGFLDGLDSRLPSRTSRRWPFASIKVIRTAGLVLVSTTSLLTAFQLIQQWPALSAYAASLDAVDEAARAAQYQGATSLVVDPISKPSLVGIDDLGPDASAGPNSCMAGYYGLQSIATRDSQAYSDFRS